MITAPPKRDVAGGDPYLYTHTTLEEVSRDTAKMKRRAAALCIQKSCNTDRSESRESKKIRKRRSKRAKREKVTI